MVCACVSLDLPSQRSVVLVSCVFATRVYFCVYVCASPPRSLIFVCVSTAVAVPYITICVLDYCRTFMFFLCTFVYSRLVCFNAVAHSSRYSRVFRAKNRLVFFALPGVTLNALFRVTLDRAGTGREMPLSESALSLCVFRVSFLPCC